MEDDPVGYPTALWEQLAELDLIGLLLPEEYGGSGMSLIEGVALYEELGRALTPGSFVPTVLASAVLTAAGVTGKGLATLTDGSGNGAVALTADLAGTAAEDGTLLISGSAPHVLGAPGADLVVLPVTEGNGTVWVAVEAASVQITAGSIATPRIVILTSGNPSWDYGIDTIEAAARVINSEIAHA